MVGSECWSGLSSMVGKVAVMRKDRVVLPPGLDFTPSQILRRLHHVRQCRAGFWPARVFRPQSGFTHRRSAGMRFALSSAGLQSIPRSVRLASECIDARTDFIWIIKLFERLQQLMSEREVSMVMTSASSAAIES